MEIVGPEAEALLDWPGVVAALEAGHRLPRAELRDSVIVRGLDTVLTRTATVPGLGTAVKVATVFPGNTAKGLPAVNGTVMLFDDATGRPEALVDFHLVTKWKTAADSVLSATRLARQESRRILIVGAGAVARSLREGYAALFPGATFTVWARRREAAEALGCAVADDLETAVAAADIIATATMATEPIIRGAWLRPGTHLDLIGAYRADMREVDDAAIRAGRLFVDARATTVAHIGEVADPIARGVIGPEAVIADFYEPERYRREAPGEITIAKNGGGAHLDLMVARHILARSRERG